MDKFLQKHKGQSIIIQFQTAVNVISKDPYNNSLDIDTLKGYQGKYRLRLSGYRFIYEIDEKKILITFIDVGTRGDIYKKYG